MAKAKKKAPAKAEPKSTGRPLSPETQKIRKRILTLAKKGISNPDLAKKLEVTTMQSQAYCKPLIKTGELTVEKQNGRNFYTASLL